MRHGKTHSTAGSIPQESHGIQVLARRPRGNQDAAAGKSGGRCVGRPHKPVGRLRNFIGFGQTTAAHPPAREIPFAGLHNTRATGHEPKVSDLGPLGPPV